MSRPKAVKASCAGLVALAAAVSPVVGAEPPVVEEGVALTVYSTADPAGFDPQRFIAQQRQGYDPQYAWQVPGFGVVKEVRRIKVAAGLNELRFPDVAEFIDPTTVSFTNLDDPAATAVLEQCFQFDLVSPDKLLEKYLDRQIEVVLPLGEKTETVSGKLLSAVQGQLVLLTGEGVRVLSSRGQQVKLGELPGGLITRPTLVWKVQSTADGEPRIRTTYQTGGLTWRADYNLILNESDTLADLSAWVTLLNLSGAGYQDARLKLIAGDVQRVAPPQERYAVMSKARGMVAEMMDQGFEEKAFFEYHLYTLPRKTDVLANTTQQITLFPTARVVKVEKLMVYYGLPEAVGWGFFPQPQQDRNFGNQSNKKVDVYARFENKKENNLGMPLPRGKVRAYKRDDADGTLEFIGEDLIDHTAKDEKVLIKLGQAFDVVGERTQTDFDIDTGRKTMRESIKVQIRNHKKEAVRVVIKENLYRWTTWEITKSSDQYEKVDARTVHFEVEVPPDGEKTVTYTVRYTW